MLSFFNQKVSCFYQCGNSFPKIPSSNIVAFIHLPIARDLNLSLCNNYSEPPSPHHPNFKWHGCHSRKKMSKSTKRPISLSFFLMTEIICIPMRKLLPTNCLPQIWQKQKFKNSLNKLIYRYQVNYIYLNIQFLLT